MLTETKLKFEPPFPTLADGDIGEDAYDTSSDEIEVLVETHVTSDSNGEATSSSDGHYQMSIPICAPDEEEDVGNTVMKKLKLKLKMKGVKIEKE
ncbi:hypothetical protein SESBI_34971 [Sesbania bispinosa]|nr:hypothetical protein SESBI_34971 [Sesbania bispinosa]